MTDIELVIKIAKEDYDDLTLTGENTINFGVLLALRETVRNGTPLPKGHGRLIDAKQFEIDNKEFWNCDFIHPKYEDTLGELIQDAPTIIDADKAESEDKA